ncbi:hypothetical protein [Desulfomonile tiedjei]|uniref:Uncharacterized protein n=1 Tax=Desulfomonile tiedjei (strain ATCC 49306 / DSM 6799 / DCB-1) TaxID=706587 RepID=I4C9Z6_DESTA|nr:hypothetical protein [Desulfomonile tiedjei]AFM26387.1 hypothetical protein Desti_3743 [Desulfomonile tiedjei DSM 6799]
MASLFREFTAAYEEFQKRFPKHPLVEEMRNSVSRGRFPSDKWLREHIDAMTRLMAPIWKQDDTRASGSSSDRSDAA